MEVKDLARRLNGLEPVREIWRRYVDALVHQVLAILQQKQCKSNQKSCQNQSINQAIEQEFLPCSTVRTTAPGLALRLQRAQACNTKKNTSSRGLTKQQSLQNSYRKHSLWKQRPHPWPSHRNKPFSGGSEKASPQVLQHLSSARLKRVASPAE